MGKQLCELCRGRLGPGTGSARCGHTWAVLTATWIPALLRMAGQSTCSLTHPWFIQSLFWLRPELCTCPTDELNGNTQECISLFLRASEKQLGSMETSFSDLVSALEAFQERWAAIRQVDPWMLEHPRELLRERHIQDGTVEKRRARIRPGEGAGVERPAGLCAGRQVAVPVVHATPGFAHCKL